MTRRALVLGGEPGFSRLSGAFSKRVENPEAAVSLYRLYYNFGRIHPPLGGDPPWGAAVPGHIWLLAEIVALIN